MAGAPLSRADLFHGLCDGHAERDAAVEHRRPEREFRDLAVEVPSHETLAEQFHAAPFASTRLRRWYPLLCLPPVMQEIFDLVGV